MAGGTTTQKGYGNAHQIIRKKWQKVVEADKADCARCGKHLEPGTPWDLGHNDDRTGYNGPECVPCNRGAGARNATKVRIEREKTTTREW